MHGNVISHFLIPGTRPSAESVCGLLPTDPLNVWIEAVCPILKRIAIDPGQRNLPLGSTGRPVV